MTKHIVVDNVGDVSVVHFTDKKLLDNQVIQNIGVELFRLVADLGRPNLVLDFANVEYLSSAALGKFINLYKKVKSAGGRMMICNINSQLQQLLELCDIPWETGSGISTDSQRALETVS
jgi:anti-sigma B factor antagonist